MAERLKRHPPDEPWLYQIRIAGHLDEGWTEWFGNLDVIKEDGGETLLSGPVDDQAALHALLRKVRDLGMPLVSVTCLNAPRAGWRAPDSAASDQKMENRMIYNKTMEETRKQPADQSGESYANRNDAKQLFRKLGSCSRTFFFLLNREFGVSRENEERASDLLAGGILQQGYQCGMIWGASLAVGAESFRLIRDPAQAIEASITATQSLVESFVRENGSADCLEITGCDWTSKLSTAKHMLSGKFLRCFRMAENWAPDAIRSAHDGLSRMASESMPESPVSCAAEVVRKMGANDEEAMMVSGFAGGLGLTGNACGALAAAVWMKTLSWSKENPKKSPFSDREVKKTTNETLKTFFANTDYEILCHKICGRHFATLENHSKYIKSGGCSVLLEVLSR